jgi:hypothetical protein
MLLPAVDKRHVRSGPAVVWAHFLSLVLPAIIIMSMFLHPNDRIYSLS